MNANEALKDELAPYIFEAGLDIHVVNGDRKLLIQGLVVYFAIH